MDHQEVAGLPLDGNAAAGFLRELFALDMTAAEVTCDHCGVVTTVGETRTLWRSDGRNISLRPLRPRCHAISAYTGRNLPRHARLSASARPSDTLTKSGIGTKLTICELATPGVLFHLRTCGLTYDRRRSKRKEKSHRQTSSSGLEF